MTSVLVLNAGSSSLKFALVDPASGERALSGIAERLGTSDATISIKTGDSTPPGEHLAEGTHVAAVAAIVEAIHGLDDLLQPVGVGHRIVHGGDRFAESVVITDEVADAIKQFSTLAPLHNPPGLMGIEAVATKWPELPQVAVFDTAFHQTMPEHAYRYAVPHDWYADHRVRRYGFHGTSHRFVSQRAAAILGRSPDELALVVSHLGNGCSATAVLAGQSVDTTMGLTPLEGLVMGTRSGDVDPGLFGYLEAEAGLSSRAVTDALNKKSGLLALSGRSNDMRALWAAIDAGDDRAALAVDVFVYRLAKAVAALVVGLGRLDALVFTGGIGENDARIRARVVEALPFLGLRIGESNAQLARGMPGRISADEGPAVLVVPTDEELMIALDTARLTSEDGQR